MIKFIFSFCASSAFKLLLIWCELFAILLLLEKMLLKLMRLFLGVYSL